LNLLFLLVLVTTMTTNAQLLAFCLLLSLLSRAEAECRFDAERSELWCDLSDLCGKKDLAKWFDKTKIIQINPGKRNCTSLPDQNIFASFRELDTFYFNAWLPQINFTFSSAASKESFMFANSASRKYLPKLNGDIFKFKNIYFKNDPFKFYQLSDFKVSFKNKFNFDRSPKMKKTTSKDAWITVCNKIKHASISTALVRLFTCFLTFYLS